jgi:creatinine amidohydrolase
VQQQVGHACEYETSMMLRIAPHLVGDLSKLPEVPFGTGFAPAQRAWITKDRTALGTSATHATAGKAKRSFRVFSAGVVIAWDGKSWDG